jgi:hypothetical protein
MTITAPSGITNGDVIKLVVHKANGTPQSFSYTITSGTDTTTSLIATHFVSANSTALAAIGITASASSNVVTLTSASASPPATLLFYSTSLSTGATEQLSLNTAAGSAGTLSPSTSMTANPSLAGGTSSTANTINVTGVSGGGTVGLNNYNIAVNGATPQQFAFDANGNMTGDGSNSYSWDAENVLDPGCLFEFSDGSFRFVFNFWLSSSGGADAR